MLTKDEEKKIAYMEVSAMKTALYSTSPLESYELMKSMTENMFIAGQVSEEFRNEAIKRFDEHINNIKKHEENKE